MSMSQNSQKFFFSSKHNSSYTILKCPLENKVYANCYCLCNLGQISEPLWNLIHSLVYKSEMRVIALTPPQDFNGDQNKKQMCECLENYIALYK